ncbi:MAG: 4,5-DOPA dioxygenase extradiol [Spirochaetia bacterium]|jgi:4,5-DOPA dioxygenase extradiol
MSEHVPRRMPVVFVGHGSPMNAIEDNEFSRGWEATARKLPQPSSILCISAHWETTGSQVTGMDQPRTIHDFGGFPQELYEVQYPAPGSQRLAQETISAVHKAAVGIDHEWGLDHGCWSVLRRMYPAADVPVVQLSLDHRMPARHHYELGRELSPLRDNGVLVLASGNIVHNLGRIALPRGGGFNTPFGLPWALEARELFMTLIAGGRHDELVDYHSLGSAVQLAVPTPEHYLPLLYALALKGGDESISIFNDKAVAGSLTMTSLLIQ